MSQFAVRSPVTRTRTGCWTCRARRKKCDEARPYCRACRSLGLPCEGYGVRLKWAIRGRPCVTFRHASLRRKPSEPVGCRTTGVEWSGVVKEETEREQDQVLLQYLGWDIYSSLSKFERDVLYDFADWGALTLFSRPATDSVPDPGRFRESLPHCAQSKLMLLNSLTYQITLDPKHARHVNEYYGRSIRAFRQALSDPDCFQEEMTPYAGVLLCSISMNRAMPFTIHLNGIASIFHERQLAVVTATASEDSQELASLIGVLDLPTHCLGRQNERLHMWKKHCMGQKGVEEVTGLPCSLIDLLSCAMDPGIEDRLLQWPGEFGEPVMCKIWEATQYAGLIMARELQSNQGSPSSPCVQSTESVVQHVLLLMRDLRLRMDVDTFAATEAHLFPLVAAGSQSRALSLDDRVFIRECIVALSDNSLNNHPYYKGAMLALETYWASDGVKSLDVVTRDLGLELGLF